MIRIDKVSEQLWRGPRPKTVADIRALRGQGIKTLINLEWGVYDDFHDDEYEYIRPEDHGLELIDIPCSDVVPPSPMNVEKFLTAVMDKGPVYVHCLHGKDRTGYMVACYRMRFQGWTYERAKKEMYDFGFHKLPYYLWTFQLKRQEHIP